MTDSVLDDLSTTLAGAGAQLSFSNWTYRWPEGGLQSDAVAAALHAGKAQQIERAELAALTLTELSDFPTTVAEKFRATDSALGRKLN
ncbi:hypothetical protein [Cryobacterium aureum]|uniref:hypothetical protein n=1 Tax=Cryobacterium aureum TaxID=995037 RepID=UPI00101ADCEF|nr:hypothetical protein [Cryobacterium aureum]